MRVVHDVFLPASGSFTGKQLRLTPSDLWTLSRLRRPQNIELGATGGAAKQDSSNMADMTVEEMAMRANQVTDEVN